MSIAGDHQAPAEPPWLSICIPTYNFGAFIGETLASIARQDLAGVEVVILDGGSTDETAKVVEGFRDAIPRLAYIRREVKGGIDRDLELAVSHASGVRVWTFSADDVMTEGAVARLASHAGKGDDVILCETVLCDIHVKRPRPYRNSLERRERTFQLADAGERREYLRLAANTQALFSFCGALIFTRERWLSSPYGGEFIGTCWSHVARLLSLLPGGLRVRLVPEAWSYKRGDNDSFARQGIVRRVEIGISGYLAIAERFFGPGSTELRQVMRLLRSEYTLRCLMAQKVELGLAGRKGDIPALLLLSARIRAEPTPANLLSQFILRFTPCALLGWIRSLARFRRLGHAQIAGK